MSSFTTIQVWAELRGIGKIFLRKNIWLLLDISSSEIIIKSFSTSYYHSYNRPWGLNQIFNFSNNLIIFRKKSLGCLSDDPFNFYEWKLKNWHKYWNKTWLMLNLRLCHSSRNRLSAFLSSILTNVKAKTWICIQTFCIIYYLNK